VAGLISDLSIFYTEHPATMGTFTLVAALFVVVVVNLIRGGLRD
jgi:hypothetical protein